MKKALLAVVASIFLLVCCQSCVYRATDGAAERDEMRSVVRIIRKEIAIPIKLKKDGTPDMKRSRGAQPEERVSSGTGVVIETAGGRSIILTVDHVVDAPDVREGEKSDEAWLVLADEYQVSTNSGKRCHATVVKEDHAHDLALIETDCEAGPPVYYEAAPPIGSPVQVIGSPDGFYVDGRFFIMDGRWIGKVNEKGQVALSVPVAPGASGSPVFWHGLLVGVVNMMNSDYPQMSFAVGIDEVLKFVERKQEKKEEAKK